MRRDIQESDATDSGKREISQLQCIHHLIKSHAERIPNAVAVAGIHRPPLTYNRLYIHVEDTVKTLNSLGIGRNDRVAIVLPNGPEMAVAFLAVSAGATSAPLNPAYREAEFDFYLSDINAKALIILSGMDSSAIGVARSRQIPIINLSPVPGAEAGVFHLSCSEYRQQVQDDFAQPDDVALVLHTSGTTSRPKIVPLTHANICTSADNIRRTLELSEHDRCLNVMPLFHIHGLIGATLSSIAAGASLVCTPGFYTPRFFEWVEEFQPSWYSAVPTMHQAILERAEANTEIIEKYPLRFIRSSSAPLPPQVMAKLEDVFNVPVIESYGMTEASHQMTSNPLPPHKRKPGSVGIAAGPEVAIMDEKGNLLPTGEIGEIVIRGASVMRGYENNPEANESTFTGGWFRTADQGYLDSHKYLFITGRLKEIINRGGEKISPREVDEVIMDHQAVEQVVTFAMPHPRLGEEVAAAVVLRRGKFATENYIQEFAARRLAPFKVPRRVIIVNEIPKGPTGKLQRIGLAERLGLTLPDSEQSMEKVEFIEPRTPVEKTLAEIWERIIGVQGIGIRDDFFHVGGDSMLAAQVFVQIQKSFGSNLPLTILLRAPTIEKLASVLSRDEAPASLLSLLAIQPEGPKAPFFGIHGCLGEVLGYMDLARHLGQDQPFYALRARGMYGESPPHRRLEDMAADYVKEIRAVQPEGPYFLGGPGTGGFIALEVAQQLHAQNQEVGLLVLMDPVYHELSSSTGLSTASASSSRKSLIHYLRRSFYHLRRGQFRRILEGIVKGRLKIFYYKYLRKRFRKYYWKFAYSSIPRSIGFIRRRINYIEYVRSTLILVEWGYKPRTYPGRIVYFLSQERGEKPHHKWYELAAGGLDVRVMPGYHTSMLREPYVRTVAKELKACLEKAYRATHKVSGPKPPR